MYYKNNKYLVHINFLKMKIVITNASHIAFVAQICETIESAAIQRGTGIGKRDPKKIEQVITDGHAVIALTEDNRFAGFCYLQIWSEGTQISHSGLIVVPEFRKQGLALQIKQAAVELVQQKYPDATIFGITTNLHVMNINTALGYKPTTFAQITQEFAFWAQCKSCPNFDVLQRTNNRMCLCTAMILEKVA